MNKVYILWHYIEDQDDSKVLGVFSKEKEAKDSISKYVNLPGFDKFKDDFMVEEYELGKLHWTEGFWNHAEDSEDAEDY